MNVILIGKPFRRPLTIELGSRHWQVGLGAGVLLLLSMIAGSSYWFGQRVGDVRGVSRAQIETLRGQLATQQRLLAEAEERTQINLNALAMELGDLQAHSTRLNALGQRLTRIGKLEDGEFNFAERPAVGGPESPLAQHYTYLSAEFGRDVEALRRQLAEQDDQLAVLESLLLDRDLDNSLMPKGMPVRTGYISSGYGMRNDPVAGGRRMHQGVDFAGPYGSDVLAVAAGVVTWAGVRAGYGKIVEIDHGNGYKTKYAHNSRNLVKVGDVVEAGEKIAKMGSTGRSTGAHVHFEVWFENRPVNPTEFVSAIRG